MADSTTGGRDLERQPRRTGREVRRLLLVAAHDLFAERGYHGVRTREIADVAGVGESVLFRNFGSKAELFETVVLAPFSEFITNWAGSWNADSVETADPEEVARTFVEGFHRFAQDNRTLLLTLLAAQVSGQDDALARVADDASTTFAEGLRTMYGVLLEHSAAREFRGLDPEVTVATAAGTIISMALFEEWLFVSDSPRPSIDRRIREMTQMLLHGVSHR